jgi:hypothetical protein
LGALDLLSQLIALVTIQLDGRARQAPVGSAQDCRRHLQIPRQLGQSGGRRCNFALSLSFQKQLRLLQNPLPDGRRSLAPSGVQLAGFAAGEAMCGQCIRQALAVRGAGPRHRHQDLHCYLRRDGTGTHLLLHACRK